LSRTLLIDPLCKQPEQQQPTGFGQVTGGGLATSDVVKGLSKGQGGLASSPIVQGLPKSDGGPGMTRAELNAKREAEAAAKAEKDK
jgi:hypothetical protein